MNSNTPIYSLTLIILILLVFLRNDLRASKQPPAAPATSGIGNPITSAKKGPEAHA